MKVAYIIGGGEVLLAAVFGLLFIVGLATSGKTLPLWALALLAFAYWWMALGMLNHAHKLIRRQRELQE